MKYIEDEDYNMEAYEMEGSPFIEYPPTEIVRAWLMSSHAEDLMERLTIREQKCHRVTNPYLELLDGSEGYRARVESLSLQLKAELLCEPHIDTIYFIVHDLPYRDELLSILTTKGFTYRSALMSQGPIELHRLLDAKKMVEELDPDVILSMINPQNLLDLAYEDLLDITDTYRFNCTIRDVSEKAFKEWKVANATAKLQENFHTNDEVDA